MSDDSFIQFVNSNGPNSGYPSGHIGYLSPDEITKLQDFKQCCSEKGHYKPASGSSPASHDNATLLRFLRARRFDIPSAVEQFVVDANWRKENNLDQAYESLDTEYYAATEFLYPQWTGRCDRRGIPVYVYEVKQLDSQAMAAYNEMSKKFQPKSPTDSKLCSKFIRLCALYESMVKFTMPMCSLNPDRMFPHTPVTQCCNLVDVSGVGLKQFWNLRRHMLDASTLATAHYPETLDCIIIIGTPAFFPVVWGWIRKWFDEKTTSKILILDDADLPEKLASIIEPHNIPKKYGGQLEFEPGDRPQLDPAIQRVITWEEGWTEFPSSPMYWVKKENVMEAYAVGCVSGSQRREKVCTVSNSATRPQDEGSERSKQPKFHADAGEPKPS
ncbi:SEC14 cytosolic factor [Golovinomyces cichoracearum]|uniref:SEC14 cytosolic factor n=1 Tax=Golovinomyces cichoracearum TaxID=62708 RepID=A0A420ITN9_9PEZI|nr:SEC14 cytosolic factor [Golovinomyces cichoracearum]